MPQWTPVESSAREDIPELTSIRGLAAWAVVLHHIRWWMPDSVKFLGAYGYLAVDLFFVMSGYIMMHVHGRDFFKIERRATRDFFARRFARIYPLHLLMLLAYVAVTLKVSGQLSSRFSTGSFGAQLVLGQAFTGNFGLYTWNVPAWSLSVEAVAYLLMPVIAWMILRSSAKALSVTCVGLVMLLPITLYLRGLEDLNSAIPEAILRGVVQFALGCVLYSLHRTHRAKWILVLPVIGFLLTFAIIGKAALLLSLPTALFAIVTVGLQGQKLLTNPVLLTLGKWSFSTYMVHYFVIDLAKRFPAPMWAWFTLILVTSGLLYTFYEVPARRFLTARLIKKRELAAAA
jgi:peptidoglycan/LPS O-acetylase OafA/YrhL